MRFAQPEPDGYFSREAFRRWCEAQPRGRFERVDGPIVAMATGRGAGAWFIISGRVTG